MSPSAISMSWEETKEGLIRAYRFSNFVEALEFVNRVGALAEKHQHHPDITINYNKVTLSLITHDAGNVITEADRSMAATIDAMA